MNVMSLQHRQRANTLYDFVTCAAELLASEDESRRRQLESRLAAMLPDVQKTPAFDVFVVRNPALRAMLDEDDAPPASLAAAGNHPSWLAY